MDVRKLQRQAAFCTDELVEISREIGKYIVDVYGTVPQEMTDLQCRVQRERCKRLAGKLREISAALGRVQECVPAGEKAGGEEESLAVTRQMIAQNLVILEQKENFLTEFLAHSGLTGARLKDSREMRETAEVVRLANILRGELDLCRKENKK